MQKTLWAPAFLSQGDGIRKEKREKGSFEKLAAGLQRWLCS
jgi:hypothetical protein